MANARSFTIKCPENISHERFLPVEAFCVVFTLIGCANKKVTVMQSRHWWNFNYLSPIAWSISIVSGCTHWYGITANQTVIAHIKSKTPKCSSTYLQKNTSVVFIRISFCNFFHSILGKIGQLKNIVGKSSTFRKPDTLRSIGPSDTAWYRASWPTW